MENKVSCIYNNCQNEAKWTIGELSGSILTYCDEHLYWGMLVVRLFKLSQEHKGKARGSRELDIILSKQNVKAFKQKAKEYIENEKRGEC